MKTNKSLTSRLKVTKNGKIKRRAMSQNHFNAKDSSKKTMSKKGTKRNFVLKSKDKSRFLQK